MFQRFILFDGKKNRIDNVTLWMKYFLCCRKRKHFSFTILQEKPFWCNKNRYMKTFRTTLRSVKWIIRSGGRIISTYSATLLYLRTLNIVPNCLCSSTIQAIIFFFFLVCYKWWHYYHFHLLHETNFYFCGKMLVFNIKFNHLE